MAALRIPTFVGFELSKDERRPYHEQDRLYRLGIKLNTPNVCNWSCPYCYVGNKAIRDRPRLSDSDEIAGSKLNKDVGWLQRMSSWIDQGIDLGVRAVTLNGTFEPTTSPDLLRVIQFCRSRDLLVTLVTNGTLLNKTLMRELLSLEANVLTKINVPLVDRTDPRYASFCEIQKYLTGRDIRADAIYEAQKRVIYELLEVGFAAQSPVGYTRMGVESVITTSNITHLPELVAQLRSWNVYSHIEVTKVQGYATGNSELAPTRDQVQLLFEAILEQDIKAGFEQWQPRPPYVAGACHENQYRLDVHANGKVKPCPGVETTVGDLNDTPLREIVQSQALQIIRNLADFIEGDCKTCDLFRADACYGGCRGTVYQTLKAQGRSEYESWVASDPSCWRVSTVLNDGTTAEQLRLKAPEKVNSDAQPVRN